MRTKRFNAALWSLWRSLALRLHSFPASSTSSRRICSRCSCAGPFTLLFLLLLPLLLLDEDEDEDEQFFVFAALPDLAARSGASGGGALLQAAAASFPQEWRSRTRIMRRTALSMTTTLLLSGAA